MLETTDFVWGQWQIRLGEYVPLTTTEAAGLALISKWEAPFMVSHSTFCKQECLVGVPINVL
jgi:hypothetical protein